MAGPIPECDHTSHPCIVSAVPRARQHRPSVRGRLRQGLALWLKGTLLVHNGCQDSAAALETHGRFEPMHRKLRELRPYGGEFPVALATEEWRQPVQHFLARWNRMRIH